MTSESNSNTTVILHISDVHFGVARNEQERDSKKLVLDSLLVALKKLDPAWRPDIVCITGDIAFGGVGADYALAEDWITRLLSVLELQAEDLFLCPGNHDVNRTNILPASCPTESSQSDPYFLIPVSATHQVAHPFAAYIDFCARLGVPPYRCGTVDSYLVGHRVHRDMNFVACNSAWFSRSSATDKGRLWIGLPILQTLAANGQINRLSDVSPEEYKLTVALMHHPDEWLHDEELNFYGLRPSSFPFLTRRSNLLLTGHTHNAAVVEPTIYSGQCHHFRGGATYENSRYTNNFRLIRIRRGQQPEFDYWSYYFNPDGPDWDKKGPPLRGSIYTRSLFQPIEEMSDSTDRAIQPVTPQPHPLLPEHGAEQVSQTSVESAVEDSDKSYFDNEIKRIVGLIHKGKSKTAQAELEPLLEKAEAQGASSIDLFRISNNLGVVLLQTDQLDEAIAKFRKALVYQPSSQIALANLAQALSRKGQVPDALELCAQANAIKPNDQHVLTVYSQILLRAGRQDEIRALIPQVLPDEMDVDLLTATGQMLFDAGDYERAVEYLLRAKKLLPSHDLEPLETLAKALIQFAQQRLRKHLKLLEPLPSDVQDDLTEAEDILTRLIVETENFEYSSPRVALFANRAAARLLLERWYDAIDDYDRILIQEPNDATALRYKAMGLFAIGDKLAAIRCLEKAGADEGTELALAQAYLDVGEPEKAKNSLSKITQVNIHTVKLGLRIAKYLGDESEVLRIVNVLERDYSEEWLAVDELSQHYFDNGNVEMAVDVLRAALARAEGKNADLIALNLGRLLLTQNRAAESVEILQSADQDDDQIRMQLAPALYAVGDLEQALEIAEEMIGKGNTNSSVLAVKATVLEDIGDYQGAVTIAKSITDRSDCSLQNLFGFAKLQIILGDRDGAVALSQRISKLSSGESMQLMRLAALYKSLDYVNSALSAAYLARKSSFQDPRMHVMYCGFCYGLTRDEFNQFQMNEVKVDAAVTVEFEGEKKSYIITAGSADFSRSEIDLKHPLSQRLLGHSKGDVIEIEQHGSKLTYKILHIVHKYFFALMETQQNYSTWFPDRNDFVKADVGDSGPVRDLVNRQSTAQEPVVRAFLSSDMPMVSAAFGLQQPAIGWWLDALRQKRPPVTNRSPRQDLKLEIASPLVLDLTAFIDLYYVGLLDVLKQRFVTILIPSLYLQDLQEALEDEINSDKRIRFVGDENLLPLNHEARRSFLEGLRDAIFSVNFVSVPQLITESNQDIVRRYGMRAVAALVLAQAEGSPLLVDDVALSNLAAEWNVAQLTSQEILLWLLKNNLVSAEKYHRSIFLLALTGIQNIHVEAEDLMYALASSNYMPNEVFVRLLSNLAIAYTDEKEIVLNAGRFIQLVWQSANIRTEVKQMVTALTLDALSLQADVAITAARMRECLTLLAADSKNLLAIILLVIDDWMKFKDGQ